MLLFFVCFVFSHLHELTIFTFVKIYLLNAHFLCPLFFDSLIFQISALILENTFTSILDMAGVLLPFLKWFIGGTGNGPKVLNFLVRSPWSTIDVVGQVSNKLVERLL